jgi:hypothetical protein
MSKNHKKAFHYTDSELSTNFLPNPIGPTDHKWDKHLEAIEPEYCDTDGFFGETFYDTVNHATCSNPLESYVDACFATPKQLKSK